MEVTFTLGKRTVIAGLEYGVEDMCVGGKRSLQVSPHLAYREAGVPGIIPANAKLRFEVELLRAVRRSGGLGARRLTTRCSGLATLAAELAHEDSCQAPRLRSFCFSPHEAAGHSSIRGQCPTYHFSGWRPKRYPGLLGPKLSSRVIHPILGKICGVLSFLSSSAALCRLRF